MTPEEIVAKAKKQREDREARAAHIQVCLAEDLCAECGEELSAPEKAWGLWRYCTCGKVFSTTHAHYGPWVDSTPEKMREAQATYAENEKRDLRGAVGAGAIFLLIVGLLFAPLVFR